MRNCVIGLVPDLICGFSQKSGIYWFSKMLIECLDQLESQARFVLFTPCSDAAEFSHLSSRFTIVRIPRFFVGDFWNIIWHLAVLPWLADTGSTPDADASNRMFSAESMAAIPR